MQAAPEKRQVFREELQKVGIEGTKVLRLLGSKVQKMEKLSNRSILFEVHEAAKQLQIKINQQSFLLVKSKSLAVAKQSDESIQTEDSVLEFNTPHLQSEGNSVDNVKSMESWPFLSSDADAMNVVDEQNYEVYESASSLSLATFASLLIEFVARLQNLVHEFEELSEKANFKDSSSDSPD